MELKKLFLIIAIPVLAAVWFVYIPSSSGIEYWESHASKYDISLSLLAFPKAKVTTTVASRVQDKKVLEVGCGTGIVTLAMADTAQTVVATDYSEKMLDELRKKLDKTDLTNVKLSKEDIFDINQPLNAFDVIVAANVLHLVPDVERALKSMEKHLKNDGVLIVPTFCHAENPIAKFVSWVLRRASNFPLQTAFSSDSLRQTLENNGWKVIQTQVFAGLLPIAYIEASKT